MARPSECYLKQVSHIVSCQTGSRIAYRLILQLYYLILFQFINSFLFPDITDVIFIWLVLLLLMSLSIFTLPSNI